MADSLTGAISVYLAHQEAKERKEENKMLRSLELLKFDMAKEHEESKMFLMHNLNMLEQKTARKAELEDRAVGFGLTIDDLDKINAIDTSKDIKKGLYGTSAESLDRQLEDVSSDIEHISGNLTQYQRGIHLAKDMDIDISGDVDPLEIKDYFNKTGLDIGYLEDESFLHGIKSYTLGAEQRAILQERAEDISLKKVAVERERLMLKYLPGKLSTDQSIRAQQLADAEIKGDYLEQSLIQDAMLKEQKIDLGPISQKILEEQLLQAQESTKIARTNVQLNEIALDSAKGAFRNEEYAIDKEMRADHIASIEELQINNIQAQAGLGVGILSNLSLELEDGVYTPLVNIAADSATLGASIELINKDDAEAFGLIKAEVLDFAAAIFQGQAEDMVPDYSLILGKLEGIRGYKETFNRFVRDFEPELNVMANKMKRDWRSSEVLEATHQDLILGGRIDIIDYNLLHIEKAREWSNTGIYDNPKLLNDAINAIDQYKDINIELERARGLDLSYTAKESAVVYQDVPFSPIVGREPYTETLSPSLDKALNDIMMQMQEKE